MFVVSSMWALLFPWLLLLKQAASECENACSGHGRCTLFDMCICNRNWQSADCSERTCQFGLAIVDTPIGDLDSSGEHDPPSELIAVNDAVHPYGTSELFPNMIDSDFQVLDNTAHNYAECSNAGICNRTSGICTCQEGFEGVACQRIICPGVPTCSGHGVCQTLKQLAKGDSEGLYRLWSKDIIRGCKCDAGYYGGDCSMRRCKYGIDPLYLDDNQAIQHPFFFLAVMTTASSYDLSDGHPQPGPGHFNIKVFDQHGDDFYTRPIAAPASCQDIVKALEALPHNIIPAGTTNCLHRAVEGALATNESAFAVTYSGLYRKYLSGTRYNIIESSPADLNAGYTASWFPNDLTEPRLTGDLYLLQLYGVDYNFGQPDVNIYLDGTRPSLSSPGGTLVTRMWTDGQQSLGVDYFNHRCDYVNVKLATFRGNTYLTGHFRADYLFRCLGVNDDNDENNQQEVYATFDHGSIYTPHVIRLVRMQQESNEGGHLALIYYVPLVPNFDAQGGGYTPAPGSGAFKVLHPLRPLDDNPFNIYDIYVSNGRAQMIQNRSQAVFDFASNHIYTVNATDAGGFYAGDDYDGDISCDAWKRRQRDNLQSFPDPYDSNNYCLEKHDLFFIVDPYNTSHNPAFINLYEARGLVAVNGEEAFELEDEIYGDYGVESKLWRRNMIITDYHTNWASAYGTDARFQIYRFRPNPKKTYQYSAECSNRGICNTFEGTCDCFNGYGGDGCQRQDTIAS